MQYSPSVGDKIHRRLTIATIGDPKAKSKYRICTVTYVHPTNHWYQVEFNIRGNKLKECYKCT